MLAVLAVPAQGNTRNAHPGMQTIRRESDRRAPLGLEDGKRKKKKGKS
jgi:hypothetical protein